MKGYERKVMMSDSEKSCYNCGHLKCLYNNDPVSENPVCGDWVVRRLTA
jgi:hypothetical protein